jgi:hypothetical protein
MSKPDHPITAGTCQGKRPYRTKKAAKGAIKFIKNTGARPPEPYRCPVCGDWHIGHRIGTPFDHPVNPQRLGKRGR